MIRIIGDQGKIRYNRNLAKIVNAEAEKAKAREKLERDLRKSKDNDVQDGPGLEFEVCAWNDIAIGPGFEKVCACYSDSMELKVKNKTNLLGAAKRHRPYDKDSIEKFCLLLNSLGGDYKSVETYAGSIISNMILFCPDKDFTIDLRSFNQSSGLVLDNFGRYLKENSILVKGDVGTHFGESSENCVLAVWGKTGRQAGKYSKGCHIYADKFESVGDGTGTTFYVSNLKGKHTLFEKHYKMIRGKK